MKIIWMYRVLADGNTHITTWRETYRHLRHQHEIHYIFPYEKEPKCFADHAVLIKKIKTPGLAFLHFLLNGFWAFLRLQREVKPDLIIFDQFTILYSLIYLFKRDRPKLMLDLRQAKYSNKGKWFAGNWLAYYTRWILRHNARHHDGISYISKGLKQQLLNDFKMPLNPAELFWPSGVDTEAFKPIRRDRDPAAPLHLFFHGSVTHDRGLGESIEAMALLKQKGIPVKFTVVGNGAYLTHLYALVKKLGIEAEVQFINLVPFEQIPPLIAQADVCMMPYPISDYWEGNVPIKILEYMSMEKMVLCSELNIFRTITQGSSCAVFVPNNDPVLVANELEKLYEHRQELDNWAKPGREIVNKYYTWKAIAADIHNFITRLRAGAR